jgi:hypothetical protein
MASIGEELAVPSLIRLLKASQLSSFEKSGVVAALAAIDDPVIFSLIEGILDNDPEIDCRIEAARHLAPNNFRAKSFLRACVADPELDYSDRRDAAAVLSEFGLNNDDLNPLRTLLFDPDPEFWGGPSVAADAIARVGSEASQNLLHEAAEFWKHSTYGEAGLIRNTLSKLLSMADRTCDLEEFLIEAATPGSRVIDWNLPNIAEEYLNRSPEKAIALFSRALETQEGGPIYGGRLSWAVLTMIPKMPVFDEVLSAALNLAMRAPRDDFVWATLLGVWRRRDLTPEQRRLFFVDVEGKAH